MRAIIGLIFSVFMFQFVLSCQGQADTIKILSYNTLNYDDYDPSCPDNVNYKKNKYLREILKYADPDIVGLVKMNLAPDFVNDSIPAFVLDSVCKGCWSHGVLSSHSGYSKCNMLYFKKDKFTLYSTKTIYSADGSISDINLHQLYYNDPNLATTKDTIWLNIILVHDLSGSSSAPERATEIQGAMAWLDAHVHKLTNYIFMGDFNVTSSSEGCFQAMINPSNKNIRFNEPTGMLGSWSSSPTKYAKYLTQSTRTTALPDCGSSGGMNDWLDHIMCSDFIMNGTDAFTYVPNSFKVIGQDGNHAKEALIDAPTNTSAPANIINDIYHMSNHMPISLQLALNPTHRYVGIDNSTKNNGWEDAAIQYYNNNLHLSLQNANASGNYSLGIYDGLGRQMMRFTVSNLDGESSFDISSLPKGLYIINLQGGTRIIYREKIVKM